MRAGINYCVIRPDAEFGDLCGVKLGGEFDRERRVAVTGEVVAVPSRLWFEPLRGPDLVWNQFVSEHSLEWDTDCEVRVGDRVMFRYNAHLDEDGIFEDVLLVRYDAIYAVVEEGLRPVNGWVFVEPSGPGRGVVRAVGRKNRRYLQFPEVLDGEVCVGDVVRYSPLRSVRMESEEFAVWGWVRMQRKEILLTEATLLPRGKARFEPKDTVGRASRLLLPKNK